MKFWVCFAKTTGELLAAYDYEQEFHYPGHSDHCGWYAKVDTDQPGKARRDHPDTAKKAATTIGKAGTQRRAVYDVISRAVYGPPLNEPYGLTDEEISIEASLPPNSVRPRRVELVEGGFVRDSGKRRKTAAGKDAIVWEVVR